MYQPRFSLLTFGGFCTYTDPYAPVNNNSAEEMMGVQYEFEFYFEDWEGGVIINKVFHPARKGYFTCSKPGQVRKMKRPYRCYYFNLTVHEPALQDALNALPDYALHPDMDKIVALCKDMLKVRERTTMVAQLKLESIVCSVLSMLLEKKYSVPNTKEVSVVRYQNELLRAAEYIRSHIDEEIDLNKLAKDSHVHPTYFHKLFRLAYAATPVQYQLQCRLIAAEDMLRDGTLSLAEIAARCGFSSQNYFAYKFKQRRECTPSEFRKQFKKDR